MAGHKRNSSNDFSPSTNSTARKRVRPGGGRLAMRAHSTNYTRLGEMSHINFSNQDDDDSLFVPLSPGLEAAVNELKREKEARSASVGYNYEQAHTAGDFQDDGWDGTRLMDKRKIIRSTTTHDSERRSSETPYQAIHQGSSLGMRQQDRRDSVLTRSNVGTIGGQPNSTKTVRRWARRSAFKDLSSDPPASSLIDPPEVSSSMHKGSDNDTNVHGNMQLTSTNPPSLEIMPGMPDFLHPRKDTHKDTASSIGSGAPSTSRSELEARRQKAIKERAKFQRAYEREAFHQNQDQQAIMEAEVCLSKRSAHKAKQNADQIAGKHQINCRGRRAGRGYGARKRSRGREAPI